MGRAFKQDVLSFIKEGNRNKTFRFYRVRQDRDTLGDIIVENCFLSLVDKNTIRIEHFETCSNIHIAHIFDISTPYKRRCFIQEYIYGYSKCVLADSDPSIYSLIRIFKYTPCLYYPVSKTNITALRQKIRNFYKNTQKFKTFNLNGEELKYLYDWTFFCMLFNPYSNFGLAEEYMHEVKSLIFPAILPYMPLDDRAFIEKCSVNDVVKRILKGSYIPQFSKNIR